MEVSTVKQAKNTLKKRVNLSRNTKRERVKLIQVRVKNNQYQNHHILIIYLNQTNLMLLLVILDSEKSHSKNLE